MVFGAWSGFVVEGDVLPDFLQILVEGAGRSLTALLSFFSSFDLSSDFLS